MQLICGQAVDPDLLKLVQTEVSELCNSVQEWQEENQDAQVSQEIKKRYNSFTLINSVNVYDIRYERTVTPKNFKCINESMFRLGCRHHQDKCKITEVAI